MYLCGTGLFEIELFVKKWINDKKSKKMHIRIRRKIYKKGIKVRFAKRKKNSSVSFKPSGQ